MEPRRQRCGSVGSGRGRNSAICCAVTERGLEEEELAEDQQMERKALVFLRDGRVRVADAEDVNLSSHAVEIRLRRRDPADRTPDLDVFPWARWPASTLGSP